MKNNLQPITDIDNVIELNQYELPTDTRATIRLGFGALLIGFGGFIAWAAWAPLDEGVPAQASVAIDTKRKTIQHLSGGVVERVNVREGQHVKTGEVLVELNDGATRASYESVRQTYLAQRAAESRLLAEINGQAVIHFHPDLTSAGNDPLVRQHMTTQSQLFDARRAALRNEMASVDEEIAVQQAVLSGAGLQLENRQVQAERQAEQLKNISALAADGYVPANQALQLQQEQAELRATLADLQATRIKAQRTIAELHMRKAQRQQEALKDSATQLADVRREVQAGREKLDAMSAELGRVKIKSPVDGQVVGLALGSVGGVASPGQKLMDIVPDGEGVVLEAKVPTQVIDRVRTNEAVAVRFAAFAHSPQLVVDAVVTSISGDVITEQTPAGAMAYYLARVQITPSGLKQLGARTLQPGMQAEVLLKTGERSLLTYLLNPLTRRIAASMKEE
jgi:protease secretion system membrane fusion protein